MKRNEREIVELRAMQFEGHPLPEPVGSMALPVWVAVFAAAALLAGLRGGFEREWQLMAWSWGDIRRVWKRMPDEASRTGGVVLSHLIGGLAWGMAGAILWVDAPWEGAWRALLVGAAAWVLRRVHSAFGGWLTLKRGIFLQYLEMDRHLRTGLTLMMATGALAWWAWDGTSEGWQTHARSLLWIWAGWLLIKWLRTLQLLLHQRVDFGWGIAYLCTLEIAPSIAVAVKGLGLQ